MLPLVLLVSAARFDLLTLNIERIYRSIETPLLRDERGTKPIKASWLRLALVLGNFPL